MKKILLMLILFSNLAFGRFINEVKTDQNKQMSFMNIVDSKSNRTEGIVIATKGELTNTELEYFLKDNSKNYEYIKELNQFLIETKDYSSYYEVVYMEDFNISFIFNHLYYYDFNYFYIYLESYYEYFFENSTLLLHEIGIN